MAPAEPSRAAGTVDPYRSGVALARRGGGQRLRDSWYGSSLYQWRLSGRSPARLLLAPRDPWPGDISRGHALLDPALSFAGDRPPPGRRTEPDRGGHDTDGHIDGGPHGFGWLRDLHAAGSDAARARARELVLSWIDRFGRWDALAWRPDIVGRRLAAWIMQYEFFAVGADDQFSARLLDSLCRQARHLHQVARRAPDGAPRIAASRGLVIAGLALPGGRGWLRTGRALLIDELARQVLADGGHCQRAPDIQLMVLRDLVDMRVSIAAAHQEIPAALNSAIERMAPMLRFFRHGDGGLALFNGAGEGDPFAVDLVLSEAEAPGRPPAEAPESGFQRLAAGDTVLIADFGVPPPPGFDMRAHAGALSFEMSDGADRLIVNCGAASQDEPGWADRTRATAAHATLVVDDTNSAEVLPGGGLGRRARNATCTRSEADGAVWLDMHHDGYAERFGLIHHRRLYLAPGGGDLRGEDRLTGLMEGRPFAVRFHLHPTVEVLDHPAADGEPGGDGEARANGESDTETGGETGGWLELRAQSGAPWRMQATGATLTVESSVYLGGGTAAGTRQIVLSGTTATGGGGRDDIEAAVVKWALRRLA
ncbi:MAG: heparinase II/III family protein [Alphaproteobacteria bacterium]